MHTLQPVYTEKAECQDCFKCVRNCPVKAIKVENNSAVVIDDMCIACGRCVQTCPVGAKHIRNDIGRARQLLQMGQKVFVSIAPSFVSEFPDVRPEQLVTALCALGFSGVSETALGAEQVSAFVRDRIAADPTPRLMVSSACPTAVDMLGKYHPRLAQFITPVVSPLLAHCNLLKQWYGPDTNVVFIGPCIAKKKEADANPHLINAALTFKNMREWMDEEGLLDGLANLQDTSLVPRRAQGGALYPVDGGMIAGIQSTKPGLDVGFMSLSGIEQILDGLEDLQNLQLERPLFLEVLACEGGCINGPGTDVRGHTVQKRIQVLNTAPSVIIPKPADTVQMNMAIAIADSPGPRPAEPLILEALKRVGKTTVEDELNCGGCGYESCRDFAIALINGKAEPAMCVSHMRRLAQNKASALIHAMPAGVVIVDETFRIVECNQAFAELLGQDAQLAYDARPGLADVALEKMVGNTTAFDQVMKTGDSLNDQDLRIGKRLYHVTIFSIEPQRLIGAILSDITQPAVHRGQIIRKAQEVIEKNLTTVQQIACLLGENAAESEMILSSIITSFSRDGTMDERDEQS